MERRKRSKIVIFVTNIEKNRIELPIVFENAHELYLYAKIL